IISQSSEVPSSLVTDSTEIGSESQLSLSAYLTVTGTILWLGGQSVVGFTNGPIMIGSVVSTTVTVAVHELFRPALSVAVSVSVCAPSANGPELSRVRVIVSPASGSAEPSSTSAGVILAMQVLSAETV